MDLLVPFRAFTYYHPSQKESASIKAVLPALTGEDMRIYRFRMAPVLELSFIESTSKKFRKKNNNR